MFSDVLVSGCLKELNRDLSHPGGLTWSAGYDDVPWHNPYVVSPTLRWLSENGIVMENHYAQSVCSPSRAALLTGMYPIRTRMQARCQDFQIEN